MSRTYYPAPLEYLTSFELLNAFVTSPVRLENPSPLRYPWIRLFILTSYEKGNEVMTMIDQDNQPRKTARATVLVEAEEVEQALSRSSDFMHTACDLLELAQRNSVTFWETTVYRKQGDSWKVIRREWRATRTEPSRSFAGRALAGSELQGYFRTWLQTMNAPSFPLSDFANSIHLMVDSYRPEQFLEVMFLEAWLAFELLVNQQAESDESMRFVKGILKELKKAIEEWIRQTYRKKLGESYPYVREQLSALQRVPLSHLIEAFAKRYGIQTQQYNVKRLKKIRDGLMHAGKEPTQFPLDAESLNKMRCLLEDTLQSMVKTKEADRLERVSRDPLNLEGLEPPLNENLDHYSSALDAEVKDNSGKPLTKGRFDLKWTCKEISVFGKTQEPMALFEAALNPTAEFSVSGSGMGGTVTVKGAYATRAGRFDVELRALKLSVDYPDG